MGKMKTYRGLLEQSEQHQIYLSGGEIDKGYKIRKLQILPYNFNETDEYSVKVYKKKQTAFDPKLDFSEDDLVAAAYFENAASVGSEGSFKDTVIFDNEVFNQDLFISLKSQSDNSANYYLELEEVKMNNAEQAVVNFRAALIHTE